MNTNDQLTYSVDKAKLRMGAAVGVLVIAAGFGLGVVMHTTSDAAEPAPTTPAVAAEADGAASIQVDVPVADDAGTNVDTTEEPGAPTPEPTEPAAPAEPQAPAEEPDAPAEPAEPETPEEPGEEPVDPEVNPDLVGPDGLTVPWPVPDPTPIPPVDDLTEPVPTPDPTPVDPICCISIDPIVPDPDPVPPVWVGTITLGD